MRPDELCGLSAAELGGLIASQKVSPVEAVQACLDMIAAKDGGINAFDQVFSDEALAQAKQAESDIAASGPKSPLHGVPFAAKDLYATKGTVNKAGSVAIDQPPAEADAFVVRRLKEAGAILLGRAKMHELAFGITSRNPHFGPTLNPWDSTPRSCGGSSSGSGAALAARMVPLALGSDTGGSIRIPASLCGVAGIKPTYGLLSKSGVAPLAWSLDTVGPMARSVQDLALALDAMAGFDPADPNMSSRQTETGYAGAMGPDGLKGLKVAVPKDYFFELLHPEVEEKVRAAIELIKQAGAQVCEAEPPMVTEADRAALAILFSEAAACFESFARNCPEKVGTEVLNNVHLGLTIPASRYIQAQRVRSALAQRMHRFFSQYDLLAVPATTITAPPIEATEVDLGGRGKLNIRLAMTRFTRYFNIAGVPVLCMPCAKDSQGLPVGLQLAAGYYDEARLLRAGMALERLLEFS